MITLCLLPDVKKHLQGYGFYGFSDPMVAHIKGNGFHDVCDPKVKKHLKGNEFHDVHNPEVKKISKRQWCSYLCELARLSLPSHSFIVRHMRIMQTMKIMVFKKT